jgi:hypothetical protein
LSTITYASSGYLVTYSRDSAGQITTVTDKQPGHTATNLATSVLHMPFGPASSWTYGSGDCGLTIHRSATGATIAETNCVLDHGTSCSFDTQGKTLHRVK